MLRCCALKVHLLSTRPWLVFHRFCEQREVLQDTKYVPELCSELGGGGRSVGGMSSEGIEVVEGGSGQRDNAGDAGRKG